jgi:hypothetical protein
MVTKALVSIPSLTSVKITFSQHYGSVCQLESNVVTIEFNEQFGPQFPLVSLMDSTMISAGVFYYYNYYLFFIFLLLPTVYVYLNSIFRG